MRHRHNNIKNNNGEQVHSRFGLGIEDLADLSRDQSTGEFMEIQKVLARSLGSTSFINSLSKCTAATDPACKFRTQHTLATESIANFGPSPECLMMPGGVRKAGFAPIGDEHVCKQRLGTPRMQLLYNLREWHTLSWNSTRDASLTGEERKAWETLGVGYETWGDEGEPLEWTGWMAFSKDIFGAPATKLWSAMKNPEKKAATEVLGYSEHSWGRAWALNERMVYRDADSLNWDDLMEAEQNNAKILGWTADLWANAAEPSSTHASANKKWGALSNAQRSAALGLGFSTATWMPAVSTDDADGLVGGCFWDRGKSGLAFSRRKELGENSPRYMTFCQEMTTSDASVTMDLTIGMPGRIIPFIRELTATMRAPGHPRVEVIVRATVTGKRFISDLERLPFPEGLPLLLLHDPPGGESFSYFKNARAETSASVASSSLETGHMSVTQGAVGFRHDGTGDLAIGTHVCVGLGVAVCSGASTKVAPGAKFGADATFKVETSAIDTESESTQLESDVLDFKFTYQTSPNPAMSGPPSDCFLMPALTIEISQVWVVSMGSGNAGCTITGQLQQSWSALSHLSAFWWITANDVEARVMPTLDRLTAETKDKLDCKNKSTVAACCKNWDATDPDNTACKVGGDKDGATINTLPLYCENLLGSGNIEYNKCLQVSPASIDQIVSAHNNWADTLERKFQLMRDVKTANLQGKQGIDDLCKSPKDLCPHVGLAPKILTDNAKGFGDGAAAKDANATTTDKILPSGDRCWDVDTSQFPWCTGYKKAGYTCINGDALVQTENDKLFGGPRTNRIGLKCAAMESSLPDAR